MFELRHRSGIGLARGAAAIGSVLLDITASSSRENPHIVVARLRTSAKFDDLNRCVLDFFHGWRANTRRETSVNRFTVSSTVASELARVTAERISWPVQLFPSLEMLHLPSLLCLVCSCLPQSLKKRRR